ncbi:MAG: NUDIX hydrolase [Candidatus Nealsonbacteria bacterium]
MEKIQWPTHNVIMVSIAFCFNENKELLLVMQKDRDFWSPPSGEVEKYEDPLQAAIRETKEEVNLDVRAVKALTPIIKWESEYQDAVLVLFHFLCEIRGGKVEHMKTSEPLYDVIDHKWIRLDDILKNKIKIAPNVLHLIDELKDNLKYFENGKIIEH